ncbi:DUF2953 domain-containing protein [Faecalicatena contorta]|uniref:DUF2953 domain-containing protein n=1 Tax=Faecalicatena contorta TaxID=39482 RepID=A0A316A445_9FIRM|nr:DUF2953 domain-containing protein [Faecalicatena contorta]PWJ52283.1 Protein of unknown function (DUF2953) [Faecalicatena contorta]SUQ12561.1 Protein of unknown function [Faecalicatena contorta]
MLHIILLILKIIAWILLAVLGLFVLLVCVVLFTPLCYRGEADCKGTLDSLRGRVRFSWFLHLVSGHVTYEDGKLDWKIRIAWKNWLPGIEERPAEMEEEWEDELKIPAKKVPEELPYKKEEKTEKREEKEQRKETPAALLTPEPAKITEKTADDTKPQKNLFSKIRELYEKILNKIKALYQKIKYTIFKICDTIKSLLEKKDKLLEFITDEVHKSALMTTLTELKRLLRFLKPQKLKILAHFGFEDPSITGYVLAIGSMIYPFFGKHIDIRPDFDQEILEGEIFISGNIRALYLIISFWNLVWDKNVRTTFRHIRKFNL